MTLQEISRTYDDLCRKIVESKFMQQEIYDMATKLYEELYTLKLKERTEEKLNAKTPVLQPQD